MLINSLKIEDRIISIYTLIMIKNKLKILDCTLRDGGYYNNWNFDIELINKYLKVMSDIKVDYVEIGFRSGEKKEYRGA